MGRKRGQRLSLTKEGKLYLAVTLGVGIAAVNTGNNLLYLLLGWLLSMIIASGVLSNIALKSLHVERILPRHVFANTPYTMTIKCKNNKRFFASYALEFYNSSAPTWNQPSCLFIKVNPGETVQEQTQGWLSTRGEHNLSTCWITTRFPFGLFIKKREIELSQTCIAYPTPEPTVSPPLSGALQGDNTSPTKGQSGDFYGLREYRIGDEVRSVDWKSTAKHSRLIVKELEKETRKQVLLIVNNPQMPKGPFGEDTDLEQAITVAASLAKSFIQKSFSVSMLSRGTQVPWGTGPDHLFSIYRALALLGPEPLGVELGGQATSDVFKILCKGSPASQNITALADRVVDTC